MKKYTERRQADVLAIQWFKHGDVPGLAVDPDDPVNALLNTDSRWDPQLLRPGDYYIEHRCGDIFSLPKGEFERTYQECGE